MKRCSVCAREIAESMTVCDQCGRWASPPVAPALESAADPRHQMLPSVDAASDSIQATPASAGATSLVTGLIPGVGVNRRLVAGVLGVVAVGSIALLMARPAGPLETAAALQKTPAVKPTASVAPQLASSAPQWSANSARWGANRRKSGALELPAINEVPVWMGQVQPVLVVRCIAKSTLEAFVFTDSAIKMEPDTVDHTVRLSFDDEPEVTQRWPDSVEHDSLFAPDGAAFARRLSSARTLRFGFTPHNAQAVVVHFQVSGLGELVGPVARECGWQ